MFLRHPAARRHAVARRSSERAEGGRWPRRAAWASPSTPTPRSSSSCLRERPEPGAKPRPIDQGGLLRPHAATASPGTSGSRRSRCWRRWGSRWSSAITRVHPGSRRSTCATPTPLSTADNIMGFRLAMKEVALDQGVYATFMPKPFTEPPRLWHAQRTCRCSKATATCSTTPGGEFQLSKGPGARSSRGCCGNAAEINRRLAISG